MMKFSLGESEDGEGQFTKITKAVRPMATPWPVVAWIVFQSLFVSLAVVPWLLFQVFTHWQSLPSLGDVFVDSGAYSPSSWAWALGVALLHAHPGLVATLYGAMAVGLEVMRLRVRTFCWWQSHANVAILSGCLLLFFFQILAVFQMLSPSWYWNPVAMLRGNFQVFPVEDVVRVVDSACPVVGGDPTMCLDESAWNLLSDGALSLHRPDDVATVVRGLAVAQAGGLVVNILARDTAHALPSLRNNVEALVPFFRHLVVVVFENDSVDGTRDGFKSWAADANKGYDVKLLECTEEKIPDCKLGEAHRYDKHTATASAVGRMARYRNRMTDYILGENFADGALFGGMSHMLTVDMDLGISLSPLGILHTLGIVPNAPVAVRGLFLFPGMLGSWKLPYDNAAFRTLPRGKLHTMVRAMHEGIRDLAPLGSRWRNNWDAMSPIQMLMLAAPEVQADKTTGGGKPYAVESAFHGAALYPLDQLRASGARYDSGKDGQQCEHIGFNRMFVDPAQWAGREQSLSSPTTKAAGGFSREMFVNPKWTIHLHPERPGGPVGWRFWNLVSEQGTTVPFAFTVIIVAEILAHQALSAIMLLIVGWCWWIMSRLLGHAMNRLKRDDSLWGQRVILVAKRVRLVVDESLSPACGLLGIALKGIIETAKWALSAFIAVFCATIMILLVIAGVTALGISEHSSGDSPLPEAYLLDTKLMDSLLPLRAGGEATTAATMSNSAVEFPQPFLTVAIPYTSSRRQFFDLQASSLRFLYEREHTHMRMMQSGAIKWVYFEEEGSNSAGATDSVLPGEDEYIRASLPFEVDVVKSRSSALRGGQLNGVRRLYNWFNDCPPSTCGDLILLLDSDAMLHPTWLSALLSEGARDSLTRHGVLTLLHAADQSGGGNANGDVVVEQKGDLCRETSLLPLGSVMHRGLVGPMLESSALSSPNPSADEISTFLDRNDVPIWSFCKSKVLHFGIELPSSSIFPALLGRLLGAVGQLSLSDEEHTLDDDTMVAIDFDYSALPPSIRSRVFGYIRGGHSEIRSSPHSGMFGTHKRIWPRSALLYLITTQFLVIAALLVAHGMRKRAASRRAAAKYSKDGDFVSLPPHSKSLRSGRESLYWRLHIGHGRGGRVLDDE